MQGCFDLSELFSADRQAQIALFRRRNCGIACGTMTIVIIGANGMLGQDMREACGAAGISFVAYDLPELDISGGAARLQLLPPCAWLVNCAGYTNVDGAETERETAFAVNAQGAGILAEWCRQHSTSLLQISTDYVFDGALDRPIVEDDAVGPCNVYGESKLAGEQAIRQSGCRHLIVRTQSLFGVHGRNFVEAILGKTEAGAEELRVVDDQVSSPTYTRHLAEAILRLMAVDKEGTVHVTASGACSWFEFAQAIVRVAGSRARVTPVSSAEFARPAARPANSVLCNGRYTEWTGKKMPHWSTGLADYMDERAKRSRQDGKA